MDYAYSDRSRNEEWASDLDRSIRAGKFSKSDAGPHRCSDCRATATMVAVGENPASPSGEYATRPHFRIAHQSGCEISGQEMLVRNGVVHPAATQLTAGASFPAELVRNEQREVVDPDAPAEQVRQSSRGSDAPARERTSGLRPSPVSTLLPICSHFVSYRQVGFAGRRLELPGRGAGEHAYKGPYDRAFSRLGTSGYTVEAPNLIVYANLMFSVPPEDTGQYIALPLFAGPIDSSGNRPRQPHRLRIEWSAWSKRRQEAMRDRIEQHRTDAKRFHTRKAENIVVFAYAQRTLVDTTDFVVDDTSDFCIIAAQRGWDRRRR